MKWFKHETKRKASVKRLIMEYGIEGYGLYMVCLELIAGEIAIDNLTFELEEDAELIAHEFKMDTIKVEKIMHRCIELGLFDLSDNGRIRCFHLAKMLDESVSKNACVKEMKKKVSEKLDSLNSGYIPEQLQTHSDQNRIEENRIEENRKDEEIAFSCQYFSVNSNDYLIYKEAYSKLDIDNELKKMRIWLDSNPSKRKSNYKRFINNWLNNAKPEAKSYEWPKM